MVMSNLSRQRLSRNMITEEDLKKYSYEELLDLTRIFRFTGGIKMNDYLIVYEVITNDIPYLREVLENI